MNTTEKNKDFLPTCRAEMEQRGWDQLDVLFVTGDAYIDHPAFGTPLLARLLESEGFRVGILGQPDWRSPEALKAMGRPRLFAAISSGAMDSMVSHYTAARKVRRNDAYTPGGAAGKRPNRATIAYTAAIKGAFKGLPTVIGGIEASLRRLAHYDYWDDAVRRSVLIDSKADLLVFGMAETALLDLSRRLAAGEEIGNVHDLPGTAFVARSAPGDALSLPSFEEVAEAPEAYNQAFRLAAEQASPFCGKPLAQAHGQRWVVVNRPSAPLSETQLDRVYALPFQRLPHPGYHEPIPAFEQIKFSVTSHRGCFGGCAFCAITHHQGKTIQSRSPGSIQAEVDRLSRHPEFRGTISDVGGPTANMYGLGCGDREAQAACRRGSCLFPSTCRHLRTSDRRAARLLRDLRRHPAVKHLFIASGIRYDLLPHQPDYFEDLLRHHVGGLLKVAPESSSERVTRIMRKPGPQMFARFLKDFRDRSMALGRRQAVVPYFISAHPGCALEDMVEVALFLRRHRLRVEQVQEFTPTPGSLATCIYHTGRDPFTGEAVHVPRQAKEKRLQKALLLWHLPENRRDVDEALRLCGREDARAELLAEKEGRPPGRGTPPPGRPAGRRPKGRPRRN
ncbi:YgiQ family radical SAM protein [Desulfuromonas sp.]|uniref:YgiQ family radical SAM protein n=1 Tax=Desulfuromonas sp. TaxID=892 RepID=UPI0025C6410C|nr:YgiQ family radical SAM protein [Desulfuromonas sp.]